MKRIDFIEGLRGYLALWVLVGHVMSRSGYQPSDLSGLLWLIRSAGYAVDVFIVISGFVIFYLLDHKRETYRQFITRRFFRLWPLFMVMFAVSIPASLIMYSNAIEMLALHPQDPTSFMIIINAVDHWWDSLVPHVLVHLPMLHGLVPNEALIWAPGSFLPPAWSISLEWQFYLVAPLAFWLCRSRLGAVLVCLVAFALVTWAPNLPKVHNGAFLPMHAEFFFLGGLLYFVWKEKPWPNSRWLWPFTNKVSMYLGRISYSIYLSHFLVITVAQSALIKLAPNLPMAEHCVILVAISAVLTVWVSSLLYRWIEVPGIKAGRRLASKSQPKPVTKSWQPKPRSAV